MICVHTPAQANPRLPDLVLLHGWCMSVRIWEPLLAQLQTCCNPWCVDLPNHGMSPAGPWPDDPADIISAIGQQVPTNAVWLGWSLAGMLVLEAAARLNLRGIVLLAANPKFVQDADWPGMPETNFMSFRDAFAADPEATLIGFQKLQSGQRPLTRAAQQALLAALTTPDAERLPGLQQALNYLHAGDARHALADSNCPSLILGGTGDRLIPAAALQRTAGILPQSSLRLLTHAGHALMLEQPAAVSTSLGEFLSDL